MLQDLIDRYRSTKLDQLDWITRNRLILKPVLSEIEAAHQKNRTLKHRLRMLIWSTTAWERGALDHMVALTMKARGHEVSGIICKGGLGPCSMESVKYSRPDCDQCYPRAKKLIDIFGLAEHYHPWSDLTSQSTLDEITQSIKALPREGFRGFCYRGIEIGRIVERDLPQYFFKLVNIDDPEHEDRIRSTILSTTHLTEAAFCAVEKHQPQRALVTSGKTISFGPFFEVCRHLNIPLITWDESLDMDQFVFGWDQSAIHYPLDEVWEQEKDQPLNTHQKEAVQSFFDKTSRGQVGYVNYYQSPITDLEKIRTQLNLNPAKPLVTLLTNVVWDTAVLGRQLHFDSIIEWIRTTVDAFWNRTDTDLIIRCHPGEANVPDDMLPEETLAEQLPKIYPELPDHIHFIPAESQLSTHALCEISDLILIYSTTVGLEMAHRGRRVAPCAQVHYANKGFTEELPDRQAYLDLLQRFQEHPKTISPDAQALADRYTWLWIYRSHTRIPEFDQEIRQSFEIVNPRAFLPDQDSVWQNISRCIEERKPFIDLSAPVTSS